jgi:hypothetical protein
MSLDDDIADVRQAANLLEQGIFGMIGLGAINAPTEGDDIIKALNEAYAALDAASTDGVQLSIARAAVIRGERALELLLQAKSSGWRAAHIHQAWLFVYHIAFLAIFIGIGTSCTFSANWCVLPNAILDKHVPLVVLAMGGLGAQLRALWFLWEQTGNRTFRRRFLLGHLAAPFTGVLLGIVTYLLAKAGLLVIGGAATADASVTAGELALCFFVGFKWEWALDRIQHIFENAGKSGNGGNGGNGNGANGNGGKGEEPKPGDGKEPKPEDAKQSKSKTGEETKAAETKAQETKPDETKPQETKPEETKAGEGAAAETRETATTEQTQTEETKTERAKTKEPTTE